MSTSLKITSSKMRQTGPGLKAIIVAKKGILTEETVQKKSSKKQKNKLFLSYFASERSESSLHALNTIFSKIFENSGKYTEDPIG